jgi:hypothetical protein
MTREETQLCIDGFKKILKCYETDDRGVLNYYGYYHGICSMAYDLDHNQTVSLIRQYLRENLPAKRYRGFCWYPESKKGRMNWLRKHIAKLETELEKL